MVFLIFCHITACQRWGGGVFIIKTSFGCEHSSLIHLLFVRSRQSEENWLKVQVA